ncbi:MAG: hypothetical protein ACK559_06500, partial [bacterium]
AALDRRRLRVGRRAEAHAEHPEERVEEHGGAAQEQRPGEERAPGAERPREGRPAGVGARGVHLRSAS